MSFQGLRIGTSGLAAAQRALETAAHNVANANTKGYSRQRVETATNPALQAHRGLLGPGATGQGVGIEAVTRATDSLVTANHRQAAAQLGSWSTRADFYGRAEQVLGPLDESVSQSLSEFWNSWEALSQAPESTTSREQVLAAGATLATGLNDAHSRVSDLRADLTLEMQSTVVKINDFASQLATLNGQIKEARVAGNEPSDLLDRREAVLAELAELTGASVATEDDGDVRVSIGNLPLVLGDGADTLLVSGTPPEVVWERTGAPAAVAGEVGSLVELAGTTTDAILADLDEIAGELRDIVNAVHAVGYGLDGVNGRDFFTGAGAADLAVDATLTASGVAASASGLAADGNHALAIGALRSTPGSGSQTVGELINGLQGSLGLEASHATSQRDMAELVVNDTLRSLADVSGVSTDEELTDMLRFQRAYEASARVITVMDEMLDRLINRTGVTR